MATAAKRHLTIFYRKREAKGAGRKEVKDAFIEAAAGTRGEPRRSKRNALLRAEMLKAKVGSGVYRRVSRSKYAPLQGTIYTVKLGYEPGVKVKPPTSFASAFPTK